MQESGFRSIKLSSAAPEVLYSGPLLKIARESLVAPREMTHLESTFLAFRILLFANGASLLVTSHATSSWLFLHCCSGPFVSQSFNGGRGRGRKCLSIKAIQSVGLFLPCLQRGKWAWKTVKVALFSDCPYFAPGAEESRVVIVLCGNWQEIEDTRRLVILYYLVWRNLWTKGRQNNRP